MGFRNLVLAPGQKRRLSKPVFICSQNSNDLTDIFAVMGRKSADPGHSEYRTRQAFLRFIIGLDDLDPALQRHVLHCTLNGFIHNNRDLFTPQFILVADRILVFLDQVITDQQVFGLGNAVFVRYHG